MEERTFGLRDHPLTEEEEQQLDALPVHHSRQEKLIGELTRENARMRQGLWFYGEEKNYFGVVSVVQRDKGETARKALGSGA